MQRVTVADVEQMLETMDGISHHCGVWLDDEAMVTQRVRENILRAMTVSANGVRRGWALLHDGERIIVVVEEVRGHAADAAEILAHGPEFVRGLYLVMADLCQLIWKRCQEQGCEQ